MAGKSSLVNSLLSEGTIVRQGDEGKSCTWVTHELTFTFPRQTKRYGVQIFFFEREESHSIIRFLFVLYFRCSNKGDDATEGKKSAEQSIEDREAMKASIDAFRALFADKEDFKTKEAARKYLAQASSENDEILVNELCGWADDLLARALGNSGLDHVFLQTSNLPDLVRLTSHYTRSVEESGVQLVSYWPLVSYIRFGLDNPVLRHLSLLDLPGLTDSNKTRVRNAMKHLDSCSHCIVVGEIGRAESDSVISTELRKSYNARNSNRTMLALTHSDEIDDTTKVSLTSDEKENIAAEQERVADLYKQRDELDPRIRKTKAPKKYELMAQRERLQKLIDKSEAREKEIRIESRSRHVEASMKEMYEELTEDPLTLPVFCVANRAYKKYQAGYALGSSHAPVISLKATKIPHFREHLRLLPAEGRICEVRYLVRNQLPTLLNCMELYVFQTHMARKNEIRELVSRPLQEAPGSIKAVFGATGSLFKRFESIILNPLKKEESKWASHARALCQEWEVDLDARIHLQMLRNHGVRLVRGESANRQSWNEELIGLNANSIDALFRKFGGEIHKQKKLLLDNLLSLMNRLVSSIAGMIARVLTRPLALTDTLRRGRTVLHDGAGPILEISQVGESEHQAAH